MKDMSRTKKRKGSSSILIIMIIITLVLFGILSVMSAYSSYKLSEKSAVYMNMNYEMESAANEIKAQILSLMREAGVEAVDDRTRQGQANNAEIYWKSLREKLANYSDQDAVQCTLKEDPDGGKLNMAVLLVKEYDSGPEKFGFEMEFLYPNRSIEHWQDAAYKLNSWTKLPKEMEYVDVIEFENIEIEGVESEEGTMP